MARTSQTTSRANVATVDPIWQEIRREAEEAARQEPALGGFIYATVLSQRRLEDAVCHRLAQRLNHSDVDAGLIGQTFAQVLEDRPERPRSGSGADSSAAGVPSGRGTVSPSWASSGTGAKRESPKGSETGSGWGTVGGSAAGADSASAGISWAGARC